MTAELFRVSAAENGYIITEEDTDCPRVWIAVNEHDLAIAVVEVAELLKQDKAPVSRHERNASRLDLELEEDEDDEEEDDEGVNERGRGRRQGRRRRARTD